MGQHALASQLRAFYRGLAARMPAADHATLRDAWHALEQGGALGHVLQPPAPAPLFELPDQSGVTVRLADRLQHGPVVLLFIRGAWCPFCTLVLRAWQDALPHLHDAGGDLLAVLPQGMERCSQAAERDLLAYPVLSDRDGAVAGQYGVSTVLPEPARKVFTKLGHDLQRMNADGTWRLAVPATFVLGTDGRVAVADAALQPERRLEPEAAVAAVRRLVVPTRGIEPRTY